MQTALENHNVMCLMVQLGLLVTLHGKSQSFLLFYLCKFHDSKCSAVLLCLDCLSFTHICPPTQFKPLWGSQVKLWTYSICLSVLNEDKLNKYDAEISCKQQWSGPRWPRTSGCGAVGRRAHRCPHVHAFTVCCLNGWITLPVFTMWR